MPNHSVISNQITNLISIIALAGEVLHRAGLVRVPLDAALSLSPPGGTQAEPSASRRLRLRSHVLLRAGASHKGLWKVQAPIGVVGRCETFTVQPVFAATGSTTRRTGNSPRCSGRQTRISPARPRFDPCHALLKSGPYLKRNFRRPSADTTLSSGLGQ